MIVGSQAPMDCAIVALSNYFGLSYDAVVAELQTIADSLGQVWKREKGTPSNCTDMFCARRGLKQYPVPRRGQHRITGIVELHKANSRNGHMVCMLDGIVIDAFCTMPIAQYQAKYSEKHIRKVLR